MVMVIFWLYVILYFRAKEKLRLVILLLNIRQIKEGRVES